MGKIKYVLLFIFLLNLTSLSVSADTIKEMGVTISSDKDTYYCEPIYNEKGECLIRATITVTNDNPQTTYTARNWYTTPIQPEKMYDEAKQIITESDEKPKIYDLRKVVDVAVLAEAQIGRGIDTKLPPKDAPIATVFQQDRLEIKPDEILPKEILPQGKPKIFNIEFWTKYDGKFNFHINADGIGEVVLDPLYNITLSSSTPSYYLQNGTARNGSIASFASATDVTTALSDGNPATTFETTFGGLLYPEYAMAYWSFNEITEGASIIHEYSGLNDGNVVGSLKPFLGSYYGAQQFDGNDFVYVNDAPQFDFTTNFSVCIKMNTSSGTAGLYFLNKYQAGAGEQGFYMLFAAPRTPSFFVLGTSGGATTASNTSLTSVVPNVVCYSYAQPNASIYVNGVNTGNSFNVTFGTVNSPRQLFIGSPNLGSPARLVGGIWELAMWNRSLSASDVLSISSSSSLFNDVTKAKTLDPFFNYTTSCTTCNYYLAVTSETDDITPVQVMAYQNMTHPNITNYLRANIHSGTSYINITSLINPSYNLPFRVWSIIGDSQSTISELSLLELGNDTIPPVISNCSLNDTDITCGETVRGQCTITDDSGIFYASASINNSINVTVVQMNRDDATDIFYSDQTYMTHFPFTLQASIDNITAIDLGGNSITYDPNLTANYTCLCIEDWQPTYGSCESNDSQLKTYTDINTCGYALLLPPDNGTYTPCNYCSESLVAIPSGVCVGSIENVTWIDTNYFGCCAITGILSDCSILYSPYNESTFINCTFINITVDFDMQMDSLADFGIGTDKVSGKIWLNDTNSSYVCISYIKTTVGDVVQTNPAYAKSTESTVALTQKAIEDREFFIPQNGITTVYWTNKNLVIDGRQYVFGVECSGNGQRLISEKVLNVGYKAVNAPITRWFWFKENMVPIMLGFLILLIIVIAIYAVWRIGQ